MRKYLYNFDNKGITYDLVSDNLNSTMQVEVDGKLCWAKWSAIRRAVAPKHWGLLAWIVIPGTQALCYETNYVFLTQQEAEYYARWLTDNEVHPEDAPEWWLQHRQEF